MESVAEVPEEEEEYGEDGYRPALRRARSRSYYKPRCSIVSTSRPVDDLELRMRSVLRECARDMDLSLSGRSMSSDDGVMMVMSKPGHPWTPYAR
jgi:hypothetical protein